jgi:hypothetical protein
MTEELTVFSGCLEAYFAFFTFFIPKIMCVFLFKMKLFFSFLPLKNLRSVPVSGHLASETKKLAKNILIQKLPYLIASPPRPCHPYILAVPKI